MSRQPAPVEPPVGLTIAGSDSGGGAGIQADVKTMEALGVFGTSVITAVTAQNTQGVRSSHVLPLDEIDAQLDAVMDDFSIDAVKTGMLATAEVIDILTTGLNDVTAPIVVDPVMVATTGDRLLDRDAEQAYESLIERATLVTPNADEAAVLTGVEIVDEESAVDAGNTFLEMGVDAALIKGGHVPGETVRDVLVYEGSVHTFEHPRINTNATHGSGCVLSSAIASRLALGDDLITAVDQSTNLLHHAVRYNLNVGGGSGAVQPLVGIRDRAQREPVAEAVQSIVDELVALNVRSLVPEVGMNIVGATPYADHVTDVAAVEGRITKTINGIRPNGGVRFGASSHVARFLLAARDYDPSIRFAINCRFNRRIESALEVLGGTVAEFNRDDEPDSLKEVEGSTMQWGARQAFGGSGESPVAIIDRGEVGKEAIVKLVGTTPSELLIRTKELHSAVDE